MSFAPTLVRQSHKLPPSSRKWLQRQFKDPLVRQRASNSLHFRARSAYKLLDLDVKYKFFDYHDVRAVVDLGGAPGGWSQVVASKLGWTVEDVVGSRKLKAKKTEEEFEKFEDGFGLTDTAKSKSYGSWSTPVSDEDDEDDSLNLNKDIPNAKQPKGRGTIVSVDLLPIYPIPGVQTLQMDFLSPQTDRFINALLAEREGYGGVGKADVILSDMAANFTGNRTSDVESSLRICEAVFEFTQRHMRTAREIGRTRGGVLMYVFKSDFLIVNPAK